MTTCLGKNCSFGLPRMIFVNCYQFMYLVISLLVLRAGYGWDLNVSIPDHCLSVYFVRDLLDKPLNKSENLLQYHKLQSYRWSVRHVLSNIRLNHARTYIKMIVGLALSPAPATLSPNAGNQMICKKKNLSWLFGADRKIRPSGTLFGLVMPNSDPRTDFSIRTSHPLKILILHTDN